MTKVYIVHGNVDPDTLIKKLRELGSQHIFIVDVKDTPNPTIPDLREGLLTVDAVADMFKVHPGTVKGWIKAGLLEAIELPTPTGRRTMYRVRESSVDKFFYEEVVRS